MSDTRKLVFLADNWKHVTLQRYVKVHYELRIKVCVVRPLLRIVDASNEAARSLGDHLGQDQMKTTTMMTRPGIYEASSSNKCNV